MTRYSVPDYFLWYLFNFTPQVSYLHFRCYEQYAICILQLEESYIINKTKLFALVHSHTKKLNIMFCRKKILLSHAVIAKKNKALCQQQSRYRHVGRAKAQRPSRLIEPF